MKYVITDLDTIIIPQYLEEFKTLEKTDKFLILASSEGVIPIQAFDAITSFQCKPEFIHYPGKKLDFTTSFHLGLICSNCNDVLSFVFADEDHPFMALNGWEVPSAKGKLRIDVSTHLIKRPVRKQTGKAKQTVPTTQKAPTKRKTTKTANTVTESKKAVTGSKQFLTILKSLDKDGLGLVEKADTLQSCIAKSMDAAITLELQIQLVYGQELAKQITPVLATKYIELKKCVEE